LTVDNSLYVNTSIGLEGLPKILIQTIILDWPAKLCYSTSSNHLTSHPIFQI